MILIGIVIMTTCLLAGCSNGPEWADKAKSIAGEYQAVEVDPQDDPDGYIGGYWHLSIRDDEEAGGWYLAIYDNEAGNPGVEGLIESMDDTSIVVRIDPDYYDELPSGQWESDGETLEMSYACEEGGIVLTNNDQSITFTEE